MNFIKIILAILGLIFGFMVVFWLLGIVYSLIWYVFWLGLLGAVGYGGYKLFKKAEAKTLGGGMPTGIGEAKDYDMSWEEYERKYLSK
ncbi:MAG: hypothetical protein ACR2M8_13015 [Pyrinomonadaceae bacterium]|nr:hypothetical protein [Blastocatellia bacterium]MDQ3220988.1 hypothetical protein [Acidobacteriota bacterium]MDQ3491130.1 hypothetical protein [Acidobacteriota bacterium]